MSEINGRSSTARLADLRDEAERSALETLIAIEHAWERAHPDGEPTPDRWGEGPSRLRLADLGLDARLRGHDMVGACPRHGEFLSKWTGLLADRLPELLRCTQASEGERCPLYGPAIPIGRRDKAA